MMRSVSTICGVLMTEQRKVDTADEAKSKAGPANLTGKALDSVALVACKFNKESRMGGL